MSATLEEIFIVALEKSGAERSRYLDETCRDEGELRGRVEALLRAHDDAGSFLDKPPAELDATRAFDANSSTDAAASRTQVNVFPADDVPLDFLEPCDKPDRLGRLGQYEIMEVIGRGGMGVVLKAHDTKLHRTVAIKVLSPELSSNAMASRRFLREAQAAAAVSHDHVVRIYAVNDTAKTPFLVMECIDGQSLQEKIDRDGALELKEILRIGRQIAAGLAEAHKQGLVHRDIKPSNILLENGIERVKITDFGLARAVDDVGITQTGQITGTPQYMAPEQAQGETVDCRADLFSLGSVLYAMCTGRPAFRAESTIAVLRRVCDDDPRPIREVNGEIPEFLEQIVEHLLEKEPEDRIQTAEEVAGILGQYLAHVQHPAHTPPPELSLASGWRAPTAGWSPPVTPSLKSTPLGLATHPEADVVSSPVFARAPQWLIAGALLLAACLALGVTEATGVTDVGGYLATVLRIRTPHGTLVVQVDDPNVSVTIDGEEVVITGAGPQEVRLKPGSYHITATKDGRAIEQQLVTISRGGKQVVRIDLDRPAVAAMPAARLRFRPAKVFDDFSASVASVTFSPQGDLLAVGDDNGTLTIFDSARLTQTTRIEAHNGALWALGYSADGTLLGTAAMDGTVCLWQVEGGGLKKIRGFSAHDRKIWALAFSPDKRLIATGGDDQTARVWDVETAEKIREISFDGGVKSVCFSPDGGLLAAGDTGGHIGIWDSASWQRLARFKAHEAHTRIAFSPDGTSLASVGIDKLVKLWQVNDFEAPPVILRGHEQMVEQSAFSPDGRLLATVGGDWSVPNRPDNIRIWDVKSGRQLVAFDGHTSVVHDVAFSSDGRRIATCSRDKTVKLWDVDAILQEASAADRPAQELTEVRQFTGKQGVQQAAAFSPDGERILAIGYRAGYARLVRISDGKELQRLPGMFRSGAFLPDGERVVTGTHHSEGDRPNELIVWDVESGRRLLKLGNVTGVFQDLAVAPDGRTVVSGHGQWWGDLEGRDHAIRLWDIEEDGKLIREIRGHANQVMSVAVLPDGKSFVSGSRDGTVRMWSIESGEELRRFEGVGTGVFAVAASPDGRYVLAGFGPDDEKGIQGGMIDDPDHCVALMWDAESGEEVRRFRGHRGCINDVGFSPDGQWIVTASGGAHVGEPLPDGGAKPTRDNTVRLWDAATGREIASIAHRTSLRSAEFSRDGRHLLSAEWQLVHLWRVPDDLGSRSAAKPPAAPATRQLLLSSNRGGAFDIYLLNEDGTGWKNLTNHPAEDSGPAFSPDGEKIAFCSSRSGNLDVWVMNADGSEPRQLTTFSGVDRTPCWSPDGTKLAFVRHVSPDNWEIFVMNADGSEQKNLTNHPAKAADPAWSPDGKTIAYSFDSDGTKLYAMNADGSNPRLLSGRKGLFVYPAFSPDGKTIIYTARDGEGGDDLELFIAEADGTGARQLTHLGGLSTFAAWSPDGERIAFQHRNPNTPGTKAIVYVMNADVTGLKPITGEEAHIGYGGGRPAWRPIQVERASTLPGEVSELRRFEENHLQPVTSVAVSPDGRYLLSGSYDRSVRLWELASGREIRPLFLHAKGINHVAFSPDGRFALSASADSTVRLREVESGREVHVFEGHTGWVRAAAFSPDGTLVVSGSADYRAEKDQRDHSLRLWDVETGDELWKAETGTCINSVAFTPDGRHVVSGGGELALGGGDGKPDLRLWRLPESAWPDDGAGNRSP